MSIRDVGTEMRLSKKKKHEIAIYGVGGSFTGGALWDFNSTGCTFELCCHEF